MSEMLDQAVKWLSSREDMSRAAGALGHFLHRNDVAELARFRSHVASLPRDCDGVINGFRLALCDVAAAYEAQLRTPQSYVPPLIVELPAGWSVQVTALDASNRLETGYVGGTGREYVTVTASIDDSRLCRGCRKEVKDDEPWGTDLGDMIHPECRPRAQAIRRFWESAGSGTASHQKVYLSKKPVPLAHVVDVDGKTIFDGAPIEEAFLFWIDEEPDANWAHPCRYTLVLGDSGLVTVCGQWPPVETIYDKLEEIERPE